MTTGAQQDQCQDSTIHSEYQWPGRSHVKGWDLPMAQHGRRLARRKYKREWYNSEWLELAQKLVDWAVQCKESKTIVWGKKNNSHIVMLSLSCITGYEGRAEKQSRRLIRDPVNVRVGNKDKKQTARKRAWQGALVEVGRIKSTNSTRQKTFFVSSSSLHFSAGLLVQRPPSCTWTKLISLYDQYMTSYLAISNQYFKCI